MPAALPQDLCWRIVEKYWLDGVGPATISHQLGTSVRPLSKRQIRVVLRRFARTGEVATHQGRRLADPANTIFSHDEDMRLLELVTVLDDKSMLQEIRARYCLASGMEPAMATVCQAMRRLGFTRKKVARLRCPATAHAHALTAAACPRGRSCTASPASAMSTVRMSSTAT